jgi:hypothetical protein
MSVWRRLAVAAGVIVATALPAWNAFIWLVHGGEHVEFIAHRVHDIKDVGPMLAVFVSPPPWLPLALVPVGLFVIWLAVRNKNPKPSIEPTSDPVADIDARIAFFEILEESEWSERQLETTIDTKSLVSNWLEVRLDGEIHKALRNSRLGWGEECLPGTTTTPEKPIPPETWDKAEIIFDRGTLPRTAAHFKGVTSRQMGSMAWVGVKFSSAQIFGLFPLATKVWPDFKKWDNKDKFELYEAACLWFNKEPLLPMPERARALYQTWKEMAFGGGLPIDSDSLRHAIEIGLNKDSSITPHTRIDREVLITLAEHEGIQPMFLFPHKRGEKVKTRNIGPN